MISLLLFGKSDRGFSHGGRPLDPPLFPRYYTQLIRFLGICCICDDANDMVYTRTRENLFLGLLHIQFANLEVFAGILRLREWDEKRLAKHSFQIKGT